jgi:hypothetical protein
MSFELLKAIDAMLAEGFSQTMFRIPDKEPGEYREAQVIIGGLPAKRKGNDPEFQGQKDFPFIINRFWDGQDNEDSAIVTIHTICGIYTSGDIESGEHDIANMVFRCRRLMLAHRRLSGRFELQFPLKFSFGDVDDRHLQAHPFYGGTLKSTWRLTAVEDILTPEEEARVYGTA